MSTIITVLEYLDKDYTAVYRCEEYGQFPATTYELKNNLVPGKFYYLPEQLAYSDYSGTSYTRSNIKIFMNLHGECSGVRLLKSAHNGQSVGIDVTCNDAAIFETLGTLEDHPCLDDNDVNSVEREMWLEVWEGIYKREFKEAIEKKFKADDSDPDETKLLDLFDKLLEQTNTQIQYGTGCSVSVKMSRIMEGLTTPPEFMKLVYLQ